MQEFPSLSLSRKEFLNTDMALGLEFEQGLIGGAAFDETGATTVDLVKQADAVLLDAVGGYKWESLDIAVTPEKDLLGLPSELQLFSNLRTADIYSVGMQK